MIEDAVRAFLLTRTAVVYLLGTHSEAGDPSIRPDRLHQKDRLPGIAIVVEEEDHLNDLSGKGGLVQATLIVSCLATTRRASRQLAEAVRTNGTDPGTGLAGYRGAAGSISEIHAQLNNSQTNYVPLKVDSDEGIYSTDATYEVWYHETV